MGSKDARSWIGNLLEPPDDELEETGVLEELEEPDELAVEAEKATKRDGLVS